MAVAVEDPSQITAIDNANTGVPEMATVGATVQLPNDIEDEAHELVGVGRFELPASCSQIGKRMYRGVSVCAGSYRNVSI